ncbi:polysaccharide biosynthesis C-terminal domain-containing protein [Allohahella marinimesophila]|uniref:Flippase n=1 Tax=Allohahella marinimesophila TaxID=1054972 RepID=A0ABP7Q463_9GAMM
MTLSLKSFLSFALVRMVAQATMFVFPLLVAAFITPDEFGRFSLALMLLYVFTAIGIQSSQSPYVVQASREYTKHGHVRRATTARAISVGGWYVISLGLAIVFHDAFLTFTGLSHDNYVLVIAAFYVVSMRFIHISTFTSTQRKMWGPLFELMIGIGLFAVLAFFYLQGVFDLRDALWTLFLGHCIAAILILPILPWREMLPFEFDAKVVKEQFRNSLWYVIGAVAVYLMNWGDNLVLRLYTDFESIGQYNFGYQIFKGMLICFTTIQMFYLPDIHLLLEDKTRLRHFMTKTRLQIMGLGTAGLIVTALLLAPGLSLVYGTKYDPSLPIMYCLLIASFFALYQMLQLSIIVGMSRFAFVQIATFIALGVNLGLDFALVPTYGIMGAAVATTIAYASLAAMFSWYMRKRLKLFEEI